MAFIAEVDILSRSMVSETSKDGEEWPRYDSERRGYFRLYAPEATEVVVHCMGSDFQMQKGEKGYWYGVSRPLPVGFHLYRYYADGEYAVDGSSRLYCGWKGGVNAIEIPEGPSGDFYRVQRVAHGRLNDFEYYSSVEGRQRHSYVYTPADYDASSVRRYPVLYLQHGMRENEHAWAEQGKLSQIMDNLIATKACEPMIVVLDSGNIGLSYYDYTLEHPGVTESDYGSDFLPIMIKDLIPAIDSAFRTRGTREQRAMAGTSIGGRQTLDLALQHPEWFAYIGTFSGSFAFGPEQLDAVYNRTFTDADAFNSRLKVFFFGCGSNEDYNTEAISDRLTEMGIHNQFYCSDGTGHEWLTWRRCLSAFVPLLFK
jgi:enterochelin esterase-like enzyme